MRKLTAIVAVLWVLLSLSACAESRYQETDFLGKNSAQIEAEYGEFDCCQNIVSTDGLYRNTSCGYTIQEPRKGFLGTDPELLIFISFDENGIAYKCYEGYRPGG